MINLFKEIYLKQTVLENSNVNKIVFSKHVEDIWPVFSRELDETGCFEIKDSDYIETVMCSAGIYDKSILAMEGQFEGCFSSFFDFIKFLDEQNKEIVIYADKNSYIQIVSTWIKVMFPNMDFETSYDYIMGGVADDILLFEKLHFNKSEKIEEPFTITKEEWEKEWKKNYLNIKEEEIDLIKFWKIKNAGKLDYSILLINYLLDGSFDKELKKIIKENSNHIYEYEKRDWKIDKYRNNVFKNNYRPYEIIEEYYKDSDLAYKEVLKIKPQYVQEYMSNMANFFNIKEEDITKELINKIIDDEVGLIFEGKEINKIFIKYILENKKDKKFLEKFKII